MNYTKIDTQNIKEIKQVETNYSISEIKGMIETLDRHIVAINKRKYDLISQRTEYEALLAEADKLGIESKPVVDKPVDEIVN